MELRRCLTRIARVTHNWTLTDEHEYVVELEVLNSRLVPEDRRYECLREQQATYDLSELKSFVSTALGLCHCGYDPRVGRLDLVIPGSEAWPTNEIGIPVLLLLNLLDHAVSEFNPLKGLLVGVEYDVMNRSHRQRFFSVPYSVLGLPEPDAEGILLLAATPVRTSPPPSRRRASRKLK